MTRATRKHGVVFLAGFVALLVLIVALGSRLTVSYRTVLTCCTRESGTGGGLGLWRWCQRLGLPATELRAPLWEAVEDFERPTGNCIITAGNRSWSPYADELQVEQWLAVRRWVGRGNTLIVIASTAEGVPKLVREDLIDTQTSSAVAGSTASTPWQVVFEKAVDAKPETSRATFRGGVSLAVVRDGPRWSDLPPDWQQAGDGGGGVLFRIPLGEGAVYFLLDGFAWSNAGLDQGDNARVLSAVLERQLTGGVIAFDEYRHGHGRAESLLGYIWSRPGAPTFLGMCLLLTALYFLGRNVRFGRAEPYLVPERRTSQEYIEAVAYLYRRARVAPMAVEAVEQRFRQLAMGRGELPQAARAALEEARRYVTRAERPSAPSVPTRLVTRLVRLRKQIYGS